MKQTFLILMILVASFIPSTLFGQKTMNSSLISYPVKSKNSKKPFKQPADFKVYSNPSNNKLTITYTSKISEKAHITIYDEEGKLVSQKDLNVIKGPNTWEYDLRQNIVGVLFVRFRMKEVERTVKVIKSIKSR